MDRVAFAQQSVTCYLKMLRDAPMSGLVKLRCSVATDCEGRLRAVSGSLHDGREPDLRCSAGRGRLCGTNLTLMLRVLKAAYVT